VVELAVHHAAAGRAVHFLQIWIEPNVRGITPGYEQKPVSAADKRGRLVLVAAPAGEGGAVSLHADARLYAGLFDGAEAAELALSPARKGCVHVVRGALEVNGQRLEGGDTALIADEPLLRLAGGRDAEVLVFDLAA